MSQYCIPVKSLVEVPLEWTTPVSTAASAEELVAGLDVVTGTAGVTVATATGTGLGIAAGVAEGVTKGHSDGVSVKPGNTRVTGLADSTAGDGVSGDAGVITGAAERKGVSDEAGVTSDAAGMTTTVGSAASVSDTLMLVRDDADKPSWSVKVS